MVITTFVGHVSGVVSSDQLLQYRQLLGRMEREPTWVMDCSDLSGFEPAAVAAGAKWFEAFRSVGGKRVLLVSSLPAARMAAATIAFGVGLSVQTFNELRDALDELGLRPKPFG